MLGEGVVHACRVPCLEKSEKAPETKAARDGNGKKAHGSKLWQLARSYLDDDLDPMQP